MATFAKISIIIPSLLDDVSEIDNIVDSINNKCSIPYSYVIKLEPEADDCPILVSDTRLTYDEAIQFYNEIMEYHQDTNILPEEEELRDKEVKEKWLNGNFSPWFLGDGKIE